MPPADFEYSRADTFSSEVKDLDAASARQLSAGPSGRDYQWIDLNGEGIAGALTQQGGALYYKRNLGKGKLGPALPLTTQPNGTAIGSGGGGGIGGGGSRSGGLQQLVDLTGDGLPDLVDLGGFNSGYHARTPGGGWAPKRAFQQLPNIDFRDPSLRFIDLTGDGSADIIMSETHVYRCYDSTREGGYDKSHPASRYSDEKYGPNVVFAEAQQTVFLADMSGDGLSDIVRIRNGSVVYWPNLGRGQFGAQVMMGILSTKPDGSPSAAKGGLTMAPDNHYDPSRIRLADIDGTGTADLLYIGADGVHIWRNQAGNQFAAKEQVVVFPGHSALHSVDVMDILGSGTACLVWSTPLTGQMPQVRYVDLLDSVKPHLLMTSRNNLGLETRLRYTTSTLQYLDDLSQGVEWASRIPFPVHIVDRVEHYDHISKHRFVSTYRYRHGHYEGTEREFRGFGYVEQRDAEAVSAQLGEGLFPVYAAAVSSGSGSGAAGGNGSGNEGGNGNGTIGYTVSNGEMSLPPVVTKSWYHTGAWKTGKSLLAHYEQEWFDPSAVAPPSPPPGETATPYAAEPRLAASAMPQGVSALEHHQAYRALAGQLLRQEVYAEDGSDDEEKPYVVTQQRYGVRRVQPRRYVASMNGGNGGDGSSGGNGGAAKSVDQPYGVFLSHPLESLSIQYERNAADPRIGHELVLEVDHLGYPVKTATAAYGRKQAAALDPSVPVDPNATPPPPSAPAPDPFHQKSGDLSASIVTLHHRLTDIGAGAGAGFGSSGTGNGVNAGAYRHGVQLAAQSYELHNGLFGDLTATADNGLLLPDAVLAALVGSGQTAITEISFDAAAPPAANERRLLSDTRTRYYDFSVAPAAGQSAPALPFAAVPADGPLIPYSSYAKVLTADMLTNVLQGNIGAALLSEAGYLSATELALHNNPNADPVDPNADPAVIAAAAAVAAAGTINDDGAHWAWSGYVEHDPSAFYQVTAATDIHGNVATISYDAHRLLAVGSTDPLDNTTAASNLDYRVLAPAKVTDINGNHAEAVFDVMGRVVRTAVVGKSGEGDAIASDAAATSTIVYELDRWMTEQLPARVTTNVRETHESDLATQTAGAATRWLTSIVYTGGSGQTVMSKATAAPGPAVKYDAQGQLVMVDIGGGVMKPLVVHTNPRWLTSGRTVVDNKGNPIKQYEPYFSPTSDYEDDLAIVQWGVTPLMHYDPLGRLVRVDLPQGSYTKVAFSPWKQTSWDSNDTAATSGSSEPDEQSWYDKAAGWVRNAIAAHFDTPTVVHFDTLGRPVATVTHNKVSGGTGGNGGGLVDEFATTAVKLDITGATLAVTDALGRDCMSYQYDMVGQPLTQVSIDSGSRWMLSTAAGEPVRHWGERSGGTGTPPPTGSDAGYPLRYEYDQLRRPTHVWLNEGNNGGGGNGGGGSAAGEVLIERYFYGESHPQLNDVDPANPSGPTNPHNLRGQLLAHYDQAGGVFVADFDFKGQPAGTTRRLTVDYAAVVDWAALAPTGAAGASGDVGSYDGGAVTVGTAATAAMAILDAEAFAHVFEYDALGRPFATTTPDGTIQRPVYYEGGQQHRLLANVRGAATAKHHPWGIPNTTPSAAEPTSTRVTPASQAAPWWRLTTTMTGRASGSQG